MVVDVTVLLVSKAHQTCFQECLLDLWQHNYDVVRSCHSTLHWSRHNHTHARSFTLLAGSNIMLTWYSNFLQTERRDIIMVSMSSSDCGEVDKMKYPSKSVNGCMSVCECSCALGTDLKSVPLCVAAVWMSGCYANGMGLHRCLGREFSVVGCSWWGTVVVASEHLTSLSGACWQI